MTSKASAAATETPILLVPYMWIGDFVRCHSVVRLLKARFPQRPVDVLTTTLCAPLLDYMPGVRKGVVWDLPRKRLAIPEHKALARRLALEGYGSALVMPRTWKSALAPFLAGIPERTGFAGEVRFGLLNDVRFGEKKLPRMIDRCGALALPKGAPIPVEWPKPDLRVPPSEAAEWRTRRGLTNDGRPAVAFAPGAVGPSKRWPVSYFAELAKTLVAEGFSIWVLGSPAETPLAKEIVEAAGPHARDLTSTDLRNAILAMKVADACVSNDSGLVHVAAAIGTPTVGIFGPTSPWHWAPLNPLAAIIETKTEVDCRPCHKPTCRMEHHRCMRDIPSTQVLAAVHRALGRLPVPA
ncbi:lipopolysaccharide heptosyltransferase II [Rhodoplanes sp. Z2-YC6860]|uniref:lipopolysaccharide heptosyltransferase II n=1 Tax=Rhodoplanes sp. Z2-YC6860 TaxID=674703 RepID=UPI00078B3AAB|nr:lipopolysaccharide heptosyltransferase II [Rhodoplanes sp. Z2-YC6860]AMN43488.1 lipopolysaccharide heptosyltransferase II [Rhodoplanes sp. Z2-YC6860]